MYVCLPCVFMLVSHVVSRLMLYVLQPKRMHIIASLHIPLLAHGFEPSGMDMEMEMKMEPSGNDRTVRNRLS